MAVSEMLTPKQEIDVKELWRPVIGYEGQYEVSSLGRVRSLPRIGLASRHGKIYKKRYAGKILTAVMKQRDNGIDFVVTMCNSTMTTEERELDPQRQRSVARIVYENFVGPIPRGYHVVHGPGGFADNRPENLHLVTALEEAVFAGLHRFGGANKDAR